MKKICFVLTVDFAVKAFLVEHLKRLSEEFEISLIVNTKNVHLLKDLGIQSNLIPLNIAREISIKQDLIALIRLIKIFRENKFDAVHSITPKAGLLAMIAAFISFVKIRIHTFQGEVWLTKTGFLRLLLKTLDKLVATLATHITVVSHSERDFLIAQEIISAHKSLVFQSGSIAGVDLEKFNFSHSNRNEIRQQFSASEDSIIFLFLGRLTEDKGVLDLAQAFSEVKESDVHLLFVGPDEQLMRPKIELLTQACAKTVHFVGYTNTPERYMSAADVLCLPSYREGFGNVIIEAAAVGVPTIASRIYGVTDAIVENQTGLLHQAKNINEIKLCMESLINNPTLRSQLAKNAKERAIKIFDKDLLTQAWVDFYMLNLHAE